jgi:hypothetical protein
MISRKALAVLLIISSASIAFPVMAAKGFN